MPEQHADCDTTSDTEHTEPTPGPWERQYPDELDLLVHAESGEFLVMCKATDVPLKEAVANARLIAAAGTAASELPEEYDPMAAVEVLDDLLAVAELLRGAGHRPTCAMYGSSSDTCTCGWEKARDALTAARGYSDE